MKKPVFKLKPLSKDGVEAALAKAEHYRLLNSPKLAESICLDILEVDKGNQKASVVLLLALTDQFGQSTMTVAKEAQDIAFGLKDAYAKQYYMGIIHERQGNVALNSAVHGSDFDAYEWYLEAMDYYEKAESLGPPNNNDAILRWNTCARTIMQFNLEERPSDAPFPILE
jgi:replication-associated recombination protein RarA